MFWNVRAMPRAAIAAGAHPEMSSPSKRIRPASGA